MSYKLKTTNPSLQTGGRVLKCKRTERCNLFNCQVIFKENVNVMKKIVWIIGSLLLMVACEKNVVEVSINDAVKQDQYYANEIFDTQNLNVYGKWKLLYTCLLYTSDAADEEDSVDLGGRRIIKKKK